MGRNREFPQRLHLRKHAQASVLSDLQIARDLHHRFGGNRAALGVVKVNSGPDRMCGHVHEHEVGGDAGPVGEMRKVQNFRRFRRSLGPVGRKALADSVDRPHLEDVGRAVDEAADRMGGECGADGDPGVPPVDPVFVIRDLRAAVARRSVPTQHDLAVPAHRRQVPGSHRRGRSRCATAASSSGRLGRWWIRWRWRRRFGLRRPYTHQHGCRAIVRRVRLVGHRSHARAVVKRYRCWRRQYVQRVAAALRCGEPGHGLCVDALHRVRRRDR